MKIRLAIVLSLLSAWPAIAEPGDPREPLNAPTAWAVLRHFSQPATPRPIRWCGWYARGLVDRDPGRAYDVAEKWKFWGRPAFGCTPGAMAVWPHHVGLTLACPAPGKVELLSGNVKGRVSRDVRSAAGVIAWRLPSYGAGPIASSPEISRHKYRDGSSTRSRSRPQDRREFASSRL